ncbi:hypothetical protein [Litoribacterium kuwaitense]|nr:hypothetical protein [Litoribacterium kuwaitense]
MSKQQGYSEEGLSSMIQWLVRSQAIVTKGILEAGVYGSGE